MLSQMQVFCTEPSSLLSEEVEYALSLEWERALAQNPTSLFEGEIFYYDRYIEAETPHLRGSFRSYRYHYIPRHCPDWKGKIPYQPLGVTGLVTYKNTLLLGRRSSSVVCPRMYECAPSGCIDPRVLHSGDQVDVVRQLLYELEEETAIPSAAVQGECIFSLHQDEQEGGWDLFIHLEVESPHCAPSPEYEELFWLPYSDIPPFLQEKKRDILPSHLTVLPRFLLETGY